MVIASYNRLRVEKILFFCCIMRSVGVVDDQMSPHQVQVI